MIVGIDGGMGSGKTLLMSKYLYEDSENGIDVKANYGLNFEHTKLDVLELLDNTPNLRNVSVAIDEITVFMDCRKSVSKMNRFISYFILQTRKRNVTLYYTTQDFSMVDLRLINHTHIQVSCEKLFLPDGREIDEFRRYTVFDFRNPKSVKIKPYIMDITNYFGLFDTDEIILPPI